MRELWETFVNWYNTSGVSSILNTATLGTLIGAIVTVGQKLKKSNKSEIVALTNNYQMSKEQAETNEKVALIQENVEVLSESVKQLSGMLLILLSNAKIPTSEKQKALDLVNATSETTKKVVEKAKTITEVVSNITNEVVEAVERVENKSSVDELDRLIGE